MLEVPRERLVEEGEWLLKGKIEREGIGFLENFLQGKSALDLIAASESVEEGDGEMRKRNSAISRPL